MSKTPNNTVNSLAHAKWTFKYHIVFTTKYIIKNNI